MNKNNNLDYAVLLAGMASALLMAAPQVRARSAGCAQEGACPGVDVSLDYTADYRRNLHGGIATGNALSGLLAAGVEWRSASLIPGALVTTSASLIHVGGDGVSGQLVGDLQGLNNIEADQGWYLYDLWTQISFGSGAANSARIGFLDLNQEFDTSDTASFFVSPPFGIGTDLAQTGENGPAVFPVTALGLRFGGAIGEALQWRVAAYEGTPGRTDRHSFATASLTHGEGALLIGEVNFTPARMHKISLGAWSYTASFERVDAGVSGSAARVKGNHGAYAMVDAPLGALGGAQVDGMVRAGVASARFNPVAAYVGGAVVVSKFLPGRPDDAIGLAVAHARTGAQFRNQLAFDGGQPAKSETAFELTWRSPLTAWLAIVPSVQYVATPGADRSPGNAWIAGVRFELSHARSWPLLAREATPAAGDSLVVSSNE